MSPGEAPVVVGVEGRFGGGPEQFEDLRRRTGVWRVADGRAVEAQYFIDKPAMLAALDG